MSERKGQKNSILNTVFPCCPPGISAIDGAVLSSIWGRLQLGRLLGRLNLLALDIFSKIETLNCPRHADAKTHFLIAGL